MYNNKQNARQSVSKQLKKQSLKKQELKKPVLSKQKLTKPVLKKQKLEKKTPEGYHRMPNGKLMKGSTHPK